MEHRFLLHISPLGDCTLGDGVGRGLLQDHHSRNETLSLTSRSVHSKINQKIGTLDFLQIVEMWDIDFFQLVMCKA